MRIFIELPFLFGILLASSVVHAQYTASDYLNWTNQHLDRGDCDEARETYALYKEKVPQGNAEVERRIAECGSFKDRFFNINGVLFKMVFVEGGAFTMGCTSEQWGDCLDSEKPAHQVTVGDFFIGETEVTQALWLAVMGNTVADQRNIAAPQFNVAPSLIPLSGVGSNYPMYFVSWDDCQIFILKLNNMLNGELPDGFRFALPTEAQWEYAARGGNKSMGYKYAGSNNIGDVAWYADNSGIENHPVKEKKANELGLYDMTGNVFEWCADRGEEFSRFSQNDPNSSSSMGRVWRCGSHNSKARYSRVSSRYINPSDRRGSNVGFRLALVRE